MEEDIKILVDLIFEIKKLSLDEEKAQAIENLIKRVKELEEENNSWKKYCIEDLEKQIADLSNKNFELEEEKQQVLDDYQDLGKDLAYNFIPKSKIREIRDKAEVMDYYTLGNVIDDLNKLLEDK